ncbi:MAG: BACON domain-containing protein [Bacteroidales bacterium]|nr:BACON domain-containing protein [Bacteroidales bacterium]
MKRLLCALGLLWAGVILPSCQKAPALTLTGGALVEIGSDGRSESLTFTANRNWTVEWTENWIHVSPSSGSAADGPITVSVSCDACKYIDKRISHITIL